MTGADADFWDFSLAFYARPGVAAACLALQDDCGADVNVVLYLLYLGHEGIRIDRAALDRLDAAVASWRETVVKPLREVRRAIKATGAPGGVDGAGALREDVKRIELESERLEQLALDAATAGIRAGAARVDPQTATRGNLAMYGARNGTLEPRAVEALLAAL